ncbi:putative short-chain dehydrogenase [Stachybotrys elegans]|uniref:3beta-hydroxysteroid 3-dehydrogenase n=1 Tax=Stachybotrys elegans TaxID=80388 RepID=A0A8K0SRH8_9HYPO|nr:putative short-chain dehydrogenase [Stachybotrys elegans]
MSSAKGTFVVTGTNGAIGSGIVSRFTSNARAELYHGIYTVRDAAAPAQLLDDALSKAVAGHSHEKLSLELTDLDKVRVFAAALNARIESGEVPPIRAIILNAGYHEFREQTWTDDGLDTTFVANYLGHWLLVMLLLKSMDRESGRIIWMSSWSHNTKDKRNVAYKAPEYQSILSTDLEPIAKGTWSATADDNTIWAAGYRRYGASKLCGVTMIHELQRRLDMDPLLSNISVLATDPGAVRSRITRRSDSWWIRVFYLRILTPTLAALSFSANGTYRTMKKASTDIVAAAFDDGPSPLSDRPKGIFLDGNALGEYSDEAKDPSKGGVVWKGSVTFSKLKEGETILQHWQ